MNKDEKRLLHTLSRLGGEPSHAFQSKLLRKLNIYNVSLQAKRRRTMKFNINQMKLMNPRLVIGVAAGLLLIVGFAGAGVGYKYGRSKTTTNDPSGYSNIAPTPNQPGVNTPKNPSPTDPATISDSYEGWGSYTWRGVTFKYPSDWDLKTKHEQTTETYPTLTSPDWEAESIIDEKDMKGQRIFVGEGQFLQSNLTADNFKAKHLANNPNPYSDYKELTINGEKAVQYAMGDSRTTVFFLKNGKTITIGLDTFPDRDAISIIYNRLIESVRLN